MARAARKPVMLPRETRRYRFVLTPLADAMFQLLIFFMLSSNLAPYSLLTLRSGVAGDPAGGDAGTAPPEEILPPADAAIWTVDTGRIVANGQSFDHATLPALAEALAAQDNPAVVLILRDGALVQDLSRVLEALTAAGVQSVQIAAGGA